MYSALSDAFNQALGRGEPKLVQASIPQLLKCPPPPPFMSQTAQSAPEIPSGKWQHRDECYMGLYEDRGPRKSTPEE